MKVKELAAELGLDGAELKEMLVEMGVQVKTVASKLDEVTIKSIREVVSEVKSEAKSKKPSPAPKSSKQVISVKPKPRPGVKKPAAVAAKPDTHKKHDKDKFEEVAKDDEWVEEDVGVLPTSADGEPVVNEQGLPVELEIDTASISLRDLALKMQLNASDIIKELIKDGIFVTINQELDLEVAKKIGEKFNVKILTPAKKEDEKSDLEKALLKEEKDKPEQLKKRPPVVTVMGHVDHGKTRLLDAIRKTNVIASEAGAITQHIGAYQANVKGKKVAFLDTPGHAAFTTLRARGAQITDIVILVVAADDGIKPQTIEAIDHAKAAGVPIIVAINKIDKPDVDIERVKQQLTEHHLVPEEWGGDTVVVPISAKENKNINELLEMVLLVAELKELKANPDCRASGVIIEARLSRKRGAVATVLIQRGTLKKGDPFVIGTTYGRVRAMFNDQGQGIKKATPSSPVEVLGLDEVPNAGDVFQVVEAERSARLIAEDRKVKVGAEQKGRIQVTLESFSKDVKSGKNKELNLIIKADVQGSLEALSSSLQKISVKSVQVKIIHSATGVVNESDIILAKASSAIVIGFHVAMNAEAKKLAETEGVDARLYDIIYKSIEDIELAMEGMLEPVYEEFNFGTIEIRQIFESSKAGKIAGCFVTEGKVVRNAIAKVFRKKDMIYEGAIDNLKRFKEDAKEVLKGYECGISFKGFDDLERGDIIKVFEKRRVDQRKKK